MRKQGIYVGPFSTYRYVYEKDTLYDLDLLFDKPNFKPEPNLTIEKELDEYFAGKRTAFTIPIGIETGTPFQRAVWDVLLSIPYGETLTYQQIANRIGRPLAYRAVGQACKANPISIVIPCHRVLGTKRQLTGYAGKHTDLKEKLLQLEHAL